jgi:DnaK suppressor protein
MFNRGPEFQRKFKTLFENEKSKLLFSQDLLSTQFAVVPEDLMDEADFSAQELNHQMSMRLRNRESLYLKKIDEALLRIQEGTFGACTSCEEDIELKRLEARPTTNLCFTCKEESERSERIHIDGHKPKSLMGQRVRLA